MTGDEKNGVSRPQGSPADVAPLPVRIPVDSELVRRLIAEQFPQWASHPVRPVAHGGWDNQTFRLGADLVVRLPSAAPYALAVAKEQRWLPVLAGHLPLPIPLPVAQGEPGEGYPHPWSVYQWLPGEPAQLDKVADVPAFAESLAQFLRALGEIDSTAGPGPGQHNWFRGGPLATYAGEVDRALEVVGQQISVSLLRDIWRDAVDAQWDHRQVWFHGDVAPGNLLVENGRLVAVIDFGTCGVGDPACDLAMAWTFFSGESRRRFRSVLGVDGATWSRGRGWALWKALISYAGAMTEAAPVGPHRRVLDEIASEFAAQV